jgi:hypothetical protein
VVVFGLNVLVKEVAGAGEPLPHVVVEWAAEVACVRQVHQALGLAVEEVLVPASDATYDHRNAEQYLAQLLCYFYGLVGCLKNMCGYALPHLCLMSHFENIITGYALTAQVQNLALRNRLHKVEEGNRVARWFIFKPKITI